MLNMFFLYPRQMALRIALSARCGDTPGAAAETVKSPKSFQGHFCIDKQILAQPMDETQHGK
jgi:hypothetical protein